MVSIDMTGKVFIIYRVFYTVPYSLKSLITFGYATYRVDNLKLMYIHWYKKSWKFIIKQGLFKVAVITATCYKVYIGDTFKLTLLFGTYIFKAYNHMVKFRWVIYINKLGTAVSNAAVTHNAVIILVRILNLKLFTKIIKGCLHKCRLFFLIYNSFIDIFFHKIWVKRNGIE